MSFGPDLHVFLTDDNKDYHPGFSPTGAAMPLWNLSINEQILNLESDDPPNRLQACRDLESRLGKKGTDGVPEKDKPKVKAALRDAYDRWGSEDCEMWPIE